MRSASGLAWVTRLMVCCSLLVRRTGVDGGLTGYDGPALGHGFVVDAALAAALIVEERFEDR